MVNTSFLKTVWFTDVTQWDVIHFLATTVISKYPLESIGMHTIHITEKTKLYFEPEKEFRILGISNERGMFDAYSEIGKNIKQAYIRVEDGYLAYNPYRVNVGSIGIKTDKLNNEYISPAYVVIKCKDTILPEYLYLVLKSSTFNRIIRENTTGSVRQTLSYEKLSKIRIPVPLTIDEQRFLVEQYQASIEQAKEAKANAERIERSIFEYMTGVLGISEIKSTPISGLSTVLFSDIEKWGVDFLTSNQIKYNKKFPICPISSLCSTGSGGTPNRSITSYFNGDIPWIKTGELQDEVIFDTEERITKRAIQNSGAKVYPRGSIVIAMYGQGLTRGRTAKLGIDATTNQACLVLYDIDETKVLPDYLWFYLQSEYYRLRNLAYGNNQPNLSAGIVNNYPVVIPPISSADATTVTQTEIIEEVNKRKAQIKGQLNKAKEFSAKAQDEFEEAVFGEAKKALSSEVQKP